MKRLLAMFLAWLMSLTNNVSYVVQGDMPFARGDYYTIEEGESPDYRDLYGQTPVNSRETVCHPTTFSGNPSYVVYNDGKKHNSAAWFANRVSMEYSKISGESYTFDDSVLIVMPYGGTLLSSSNTSDGHSMLLSCTVGENDYRIQIENMERWWCCLAKIQPDDTNALGESVWVHTCSELKGTQFPQGYVLGKAQAGTTIQVLGSDNKPIPLQEFYNH